MKKVLFLIHDLGQGGAEKVLVNLVNNMDNSKFDITVLSLFGGGVNERFLHSKIRYKTVYKKSIPANSLWMKLFTPERLHKMYIKEKYDIEISYLEGPCARIISGCQNSKTKLVSWIHTKFSDESEIYRPFRDEAEAKTCYQRFDYTAFVSKDVLSKFLETIPLHKDYGVLYNTVESDKIIKLSKEDITNFSIEQGVVNLVTVGTLKSVKGYDRLLRICKRLQDENYRFHLYMLGTGPLKSEFQKYIETNQLNDCVSMVGYDSNPYKYLSKCDLYVCSSNTEGFSTAATEALIVGTPVCTVDVSGMKEMLGENNEYGIVTENSEDALFEGIKMLLDDPELLEHYKHQAEIKGKDFSKEKTVDAVEKMLISL